MTKHTIPTDHDIHLDEELLFPRLDADDSFGIYLYQKGYHLDIEFDSTGDSNIIPIIRAAYWDAFNVGVLDAGVNLLRIIMIALCNYKLTNPNDKELPLLDPLHYILERLLFAEHPAGEYYEALGYMLGIMSNELTSEESHELGLDLMTDLALDDNPYALDFFSMFCD